MKSSTNSLIKLHIAVLLFGFSSLFGKLIPVSPVVIVFGRTLFASIALYLTLLSLRKSIKINSKGNAMLIFSGGILFAVHWFTFFKSVQVSNVAIAVLTFSTYPVFVTFLEPYFYKERIRLFDIVIALVTLGGVLLVVPKFDWSNSYAQGAFWGILSGISGAFLSLACKVLIEKHSSMVISFYQYLTCALVTLPFVVYVKPEITAVSLMLLILLGTVFTAVSGTLFVSSLKNIKVQLSSIITALEPVYAIILAVFLLSEFPPVRTILGGVIILSAVTFATFFKQEETTAVKK